MKKIVEGYLTSGQVAKMLGVSVVTLTNWDYRGIFVPEKRVGTGQHRRYSPEQVEKFLDEMKNPCAS